MKRKILFVIFLILLTATFYIGYSTFKKNLKKNQYYILCMGDSITESNYGNYTRYLENFFKSEGTKVRIFSRARPGNNSKEYLQYLKKTEFLKKVNPDITIIMLGTNDVRTDGDCTSIQQYKKNMKEIIHILKRHKNPDGSNTNIFIATIPPIFNIDLNVFDQSSKIRIRTEINPAIKELAKEEKLKLLNVYTLFSNNPELLPGVHPSEKGYKLIAQFIFMKVQSYIRKMSSGIQN